MEVTNNLLAFLVIIAMVVTITGTLSMLSLMPGVQLPITGMAQGTAIGTATATLSAEANIKLLVSSIDFGSISTGEEKTTMYLSPLPFVLNNNGSTKINVSIAEANQTGNGLLWDLDDNATYFEYNCTPNSTSTSALWYASWTPFNDSYEAGSFVTEAANLDPTPRANLVYNLSNEGGKDQVNIHINVTGPDDETSGIKTASVLFNAELG